MASVAQLTANRANAQRSTGPRSEEGKAASRFNALTYGLEARSRVIPGENPAELESLAAAYYRQFNPVGPLEDFLVETIVAADWNRRRYTRVEAQLYRMLMSLSDPPSDAAAAFGGDVTGAKILQSAFRQSASAERSYFRALTELRRAQKERLAEETEVEAAPRRHPRAAPSPSRGRVRPSNWLRSPQSAASGGSRRRPASFRAANVRERLQFPWVTPIPSRIPSRAPSESGCSAPG
jgi:hypothetical protein